MKRKLFVLGLISVFVGSMVSPPLLRAQNPEDIPSEKEIRQVREKIEALRAWRLTKELQLNEQTAARLFPAIREADEQRLRIEANNREQVRLLQQELENSNPDPDKVNQNLNRLRENRREMNRIEEEHMEKVGSILSPTDLAKYLMFQFRFERELRERAYESRRDRRQPRDDPRHGDSPDWGPGATESGPGESGPAGGGPSGGSGSRGR